MNEPDDFTQRMELLDRLQHARPTTTTVGQTDLARWASAQLGLAFSDADVEAALRPPVEPVAPPVKALAEVPPIRAVDVRTADATDGDDAPPSKAQQAWGFVERTHYAPLVAGSVATAPFLPAFVWLPMVVISSSACVVGHVKRLRTTAGLGETTTEPGVARVGSAIVQGSQQVAGLAQRAWASVSRRRVRHG